MRADILHQARAIRASMDAAASALTDEQAARSPRLYPTWAAGLTVKAGDRLYYPGTDRLYKVREGKGHTTQADWAPDVAVSLWVPTSDPAEEWPKWAQPIGAHDAYNAGDKVSHSDKKWTSDLDGNVWEPGVYGWTEVTA